MARTVRGLALVLLVGALGTAGAAEKISVLIVDGQNNHRWQATTPLIKDMLLKTGRFDVTVATSPDKKAPKDAWAAFRPDFSKHAVVLMNYTGASWPAEVNQAFEKYMQDGGGLVFYHAAVFSFPGWAEWNKMMGMGWRNNKFGERLYLDDDGKAVRQPKGEGPGGGHGPAHPFEVQVREPEHPVMKGMPAKWTHPKDELYHGMRGPAQNMTILATAFSAKEKRGTGGHEPMAWTVPYGKGRVFVTLLGHDATPLTEPVAVALLCRGTEWAATGAVTLPAP
jgi:type 1 glutamine amidotransferase